MQNTKSSNKDLPEYLESLNAIRYHDIINEARANHFHDFKSPLDVVCPKVHLVERLGQFPELAPLIQDVINGEYDDQADEEDKASMRNDLPESMWDVFGLNDNK